MAKKDQVGKTVWVSCRAVAACEGKHSTVEMVRKINGSTAIRYRCQSCKRLFQIVF